MARRRAAAPPAVPAPLVDGPIVEAVRRLWHGRYTTYQDLCLSLGEIALDLPEGSSLTGRGHEMLYRHGHRYPSGYSLIPWVLDVADQNLLAGAVLLDCLGWYVSALGFVLPDRVPRFPEREHKKDWTERVHEYYVEFEVPVGWEFEYLQEVYSAGHRGVALVKRCHLSESWYDAHAGFGSLLGLKGQDVERTVGFDIPCVYFPDLRIEGETLQDDGTGRSIGHGASLPYAFVLRAFRKPWNRETVLEFTPRPTNQEVEALARSSVTRLQEKWRQIIASRET